MKLLVYSHYFAPSIGGVETIVMSLARGLAELRLDDGAPEFELTLATQTPRSNFDDASLPFRVVRQPGLWQLLRLVREADIVHLAGPSFAPMLLARLTGKPFVVEHHGYQAVCPNGLLVHMPDRAICPGHFQARNYSECLRCESAQNSFVKAATKVLAGMPRISLVRRAAANIAVSRHVQDRVSAPHSQVIYHGVEAPPAATIYSDIPAGAEAKVCFTFIGRFVWEKGISVFVTALALLRKSGLKFEAKLIGDGPERPKLESEIDRAGLKPFVRLTGYLTEDAIAAELGGTSVIVMPSICEETAGLAAIEQMVRGRLIVASHIGGLSEIVGEAGLKFPPGDSAALATQMKAVIENPKLISNFGAKARSTGLARFERSSMIGKHAALYRQLADLSAK